MAKDPTSTAPPRQLVEYFFVATKTGAGDEALTFQYPATTEADEYPPNILMFMFPCTSSPAHGGLLPPPVYNTFVLTTASGAALYGTSICFYALASSSELQHTLTSLCFVSQWPFCGPLLKYLEQLAILGVHQARQVDYVGVEKSLANLFHEVPLPVRGLAGVVASIGDTDVLLKRYTMHEVPFEMDMEFLEYTFAILTPDTLLDVLCHLLLEHAVLLVGVDTLFVTAVAETLRHLLFPLQWDHVFIPVVPPGVDMATLLDAPVPFVAGAHPLQLEGAALPPTVVRVDLPEGRVTSAIELPTLPDAVVAMKDRLATVLKKTSSQLSRRLWERRIAFQKALYSNNKGDLMYERGKFLLGSSALVRKVAKSFTHLIGDLVAGHEHCLRGDVLAYVSTKPASQQAFYSALADTNAFQAFLDGMASPHEATRALRFFQQQQKQPPTTIKSPLPSLSAQETLQFHVAMAPDTPALEPQNDALNLQFHVTFPALDVTAFGPLRQSLPAALTEIEPDDVASLLVGRRSSSTVTTPEARAPVLVWLDSWLSSSEKGKAVQSVFRRTKTLGSPTRMSPLHRTLSQNASRSDGQRPWLLTSCSPACASRVTQSTIALEESIRAKTSDALDAAYVCLIDAFAMCEMQHHMHDIRHVFAACLGPGPPLGSIYNKAPYWRPFSHMMHAFLKRGEVHEAVKWFSQVSTAPSANGSSAPVQSVATCLEHELESLLFRIYATFSVGTLGVRIGPYVDGKGAVVTGLDESGPRQIREQDVLESVNGRLVTTEPFSVAARVLQDAPRPVTLTLLRGLPALEKCQGELVLRPRRFVNDKFGWLHRESVRVTLLSDCTDCGHRLSHAELERQPNVVRCPTCGSSLAPHFCVIQNDIASEPVVFLPWTTMKTRLQSFHGASLASLLATDAGVYWNLFLKCLVLDCDLGALFPMATPLTPQDNDNEPSTMAEPSPKKDDADVDDLRALCRFVLRQCQDDAAHCSMATRLLSAIGSDNADDDRDMRTAEKRDLDCDGDDNNVHTLGQQPGGAHDWLFPKTADLGDTKHAAEDVIERRHSRTRSSDHT